MKNELKAYFEVDEAAFYINDEGIRKFRGVGHNYGDCIRNDKAVEQSKLPPISYSLVFSLVNEFLEMIRYDGGATQKNHRCEYIMLDNKRQLVLDNGIIAIGCSWNEPVWNNKKREYTYYDKKYDRIKEVFGLNSANDVVWMKFTTKGHVGVIAKGFDVNYKYTNSSGILVNEVNEEWDSSFVLIFPLTPEMLKNFTKGEIECAIGNYLISKNIPIIDYYSHNN